MQIEPAYPFFDEAPDSDVELRRGIPDPARLRAFMWNHEREANRWPESRFDNCLKSCLWYLFRAFEYFVTFVCLPIVAQNCARLLRILIVDAMYGTGVEILFSFQVEYLSLACELAKPLVEADCELKRAMLRRTQPFVAGSRLDIGDILGRKEIEVVRAALIGTAILAIMRCLYAEFVTFAKQPEYEALPIFPLKLLLQKLRQARAQLRRAQFPAQLSHGPRLPRIMIDLPCA